MALVKCPRCELNYMNDTDTMCSVCRREVRGESEQFEMIELCSECGENPVVPGQELCASCLKECRHDAIFYFLGADIGGQGSRMQTNREGDLTHWIISSPGREPFTITVDRNESNKY